MFFKKKFRKNQLNLFISIGAGINQLPLIKEAKKHGLHVIGIDNSTSSPGLLEADIKIQESILDYEEIYKKIRELLIDGKIVAILTRSYGEAIRTNAYLCEKLNIDFIPFENIDSFLNKKKMKNILKQNNIKTPSFSTYSKKKKKPYKYPCVIKPVTGHAKTGVKLLKEKKELNDYMKSNDGSDHLIEEYIDGDEIIAIGLVCRKKFNLYVISDKTHSEPPYFVDLVHISPSKYHNKWDEITQIGQKIADSFGIINSPLLIELKINTENEIYVIETAPEFGGEFIADQMIPNLINTSIMKNAIKAMSEKSFTDNNYRKTFTNIVIKYITSKSGYLNSFTPLSKSLKKNSLIFYKIFSQIGSKVARPRNNHERIGVIITKGKTREAAIDSAERYYKHLNFSITRNKKSDE